MNKNENIHIRIEISKDPITKRLNLVTSFDPNAPNFKRDETGFQWIPTDEEMAFINEAFEIIQRKK